MKRLKQAFARPHSSTTDCSNSALGSACFVFDSLHINSLCFLFLFFCASMKVFVGLEDIPYFYFYCIELLRASTPGSFIWHSFALSGYTKAAGLQDAPFFHSSSAPASILARSNSLHFGFGFAAWPFFAGLHRLGGLGHCGYHG